MVDAHVTVVEIEETVQQEDQRIYTWYPEEDDTSAAVSVISSISLLTSVALILKYL